MNSPFHAGERSVQQRLGVRPEADRGGRMIAPTVSAPLAKALSTMRMAAVATRDGDGRLWTSLLTGRAGFIGCVGETLLHVLGVRAPGDVMAETVPGRPELGMVAIDLARRLRVRVNGRA